MKDHEQIISYAVAAGLHHVGFSIITKKVFFNESFNFVTGIRKAT